MESTIKQAEEERNRSLDSAKRLYEEYKPLKDDVDKMRGTIGLDKLPELQEEEEKFTPEYGVLIVKISHGKFEPKVRCGVLIVEMKQG